MEKDQEVIVEQGEYSLIANTGKDFKVTHLVLKVADGSKRVWKVKEMSEKGVSFDIENFA